MVRVVERGGPRRGLTPRWDAGTPTSRKNFSWPAGEQMQIRRAGFEEAFWNW